jgi:hypothetical protein
MMNDEFLPRSVFIIYHSSFFFQKDCNLFSGGAVRGGINSLEITFSTTKKK